MNHLQMTDEPPPGRLDREASKKRTREQTQELFESIHALSKKGTKNAQIARTLGIHRHTVEKYLAFNVPPVRRHFTKKVRRHRTLRRLHPGTLAAGLPQRHPNLAGDY